MDNDKRLENAINFLLFTEFGLTLCDDVDMIFRSCVSKAYFDATMQGAYNARIEKEKKKDSNNIKEETQAYIEGELKAHFSQNIDKKEPFNIWHHAICVEIESRYEEITDKDDESRRAFTYGNAQKWLNMSIKYLYILCSLFSEFKHDSTFVKEYEPAILGFAPEFNVPVDSYIIDAIWDNREVTLPVIGRNPETVRKKTYAKPSDHVQGWSRWDEDTYDHFQRSLKEHLGEGSTPIDWEATAWIEQARNRKTPPKQ